MRRVTKLLAVAASAALTLTACGGSNSTSGSTTTGGAGASGSSAAKLKVGVAFDTGGRGDGTFNDSAGRGLDKAVSELGVKKIELEAVKDGGSPTNLQLLAQQKANPIIGVGFLFADADALSQQQTRTPRSPSSTRVVDPPNVRASSSPRTRARSSSAPPRR